MNFDIPEIPLEACAAGLVAPVTKWGTRPRRDPMPGTYHFYSADYTFRALLRDPAPVVASGCEVAVEVNVSTTDAMSEAEILWITYQKRMVTRAWADAGIKILADINVAAKAWDINLIGIPSGWTAYALRAHRGVDVSAIEECRRHACHHAGTEDITFVVFGGGRRRVGSFCKASGWTWVPEHRQVVAGLERPFAWI